MPNAIKRFLRTGLKSASGVLGADQRALLDEETAQRQRNQDMIASILGYSRLDQSMAATEESRARTEQIQNPPTKTAPGFELSAGQSRFEIDPATGLPKEVASLPPKEDKSEKKSGIKYKLEIAPGFTAEGETIDDLKEIAAGMGLGMSDWKKLMAGQGGQPKETLTPKDVLGVREKMQLENPDDNPDSLTAAIVSGAQRVSDSLGIGKQSPFGDGALLPMSAMGAKPIAGEQGATGGSQLSASTEQDWAVPNALKDDADVKAAMQDLKDGKATEQQVKEYIKLRLSEMIGQ
jgi:hypothetical protein